ncbi:hypothetical protein F5141DRAFT_1217507 [Pisolithus sp. B1]|nr:hypothetical protein F5141DRAFT_1217507 [Pisolithus sp. B1]
MGHLFSFLRDFFPPRSKYTTDDIPDLTGRVVLVTGANSGIGKETARVLLTKNAKVWIACRDIAKGEAALKELKERTGRDAYLLKLNLANLQSVKEASEEFLSKETQLHVLFNNAGVMHPPIQLLTDDGYDLQFGTNVLGHFYLTKLLLPTLLSTANSSPVGTIRISKKESAGHSENATVVFSKELHRRYGDQGIVSTSVNPGRSQVLRTYLCLTSVVNLDFSGTQFRAAPYSDRYLSSCFKGMVLYHVSYGALTQLYAGTSPEAARLGGQHLVPWALVGKCRPDTQDPQLGRELWAYLEEQVENI